MAIEDTMRNIANLEIDNAAFTNLPQFLTDLVPSIGGGQAQELQSRLAEAQKAKAEYTAIVGNAAISDKIKTMHKNIAAHAENEYKKAAIHHTALGHMTLNANFMAYINSVDATGNPLIPIPNRYDFMSKISEEAFYAVARQ